jgi:hypothetical protein
MRRVTTETKIAPRILVYASALALACICSFLGWKGDGFFVAALIFTLFLIFSVSGIWMKTRNIVVKSGLISIDASSTRVNSSQGSVALLLAVFLLACVFANQFSFFYSIRETQERGQTLKDELVKFHKAHDRYPGDLGELDPSGAERIPSPPVDPEGWHYVGKSDCFVIQFSTGLSDIYTLTDKVAWTTMSPGKYCYELSCYSL